MPIGVNSNVQDEKLFLTGMVASIDGKILIKDQTIGSIYRPEDVGRKLAEKLKSQGADDILSEIFEHFRNTQN